ncbi:MAG: hypothetical protein NWE92_01975 [Candidatus Bathyarchaeota archaeon]|nr:hypothetical protein [Candidatus Bathyarchaeota archaeon]
MRQKTEFPLKYSVEHPEGLVLLAGIFIALFFIFLLTLDVHTIIFLGLPAAAMAIFLFYLMHRIMRYPVRRFQEIIPSAP